MHADSYLQLLKHQSANQRREGDGDKRRHDPVNPRKTAV
jgi:hypothetical protein